MDKEISVATRHTSVDYGRGDANGDFYGKTAANHTATAAAVSPVDDDSSDSRRVTRHGQPQLVSDTIGDAGEATAASGSEPYQDREHHLTWREKLRFFATKEFWFILALGQFLAICVTGTNTLTTLLANAGTSIPAFQSFFNYVLLNIMYTGWTLYKYGPKKWGKMVLKDGWKYIILAFFDVEGNYFTVLAYRYTTILSAQLINFWAIVIVVVISFIFLKVRYHWAQVGGILVCVAGMGLLLASDHITGVNGGQIPGSIQLKGDLFALVGATCYGLSNVYEEWFVSGRPLYEVVGQLAFWGMIINGVQAAIFDRASFRAATWNGQTIGYLVGYTLILTLFYTLVPVLYRLSSAAFFNISLLTGNFWGVIVGLRIFHLHVHWLYPIAFTLIMVGHFVYYLGKGVLGEAKKAWLGEHQEKGVSGMFTARRKLERGQVGPESAGVAV